MDSPVQTEAKGRLIVLPFKGTLDDFFKQLKKNNLEMDAVSLGGIGLRLQEAKDNNKGIKICCLGDLEDKSRLNKLKITKEDLKEIYIEGHGEIFEKKGYATVFSGQHVPANEIATALGQLFKHCGYQPNDKIDSRIVIGCCFGAAKKDENGYDILSIAKAIEKKFSEDFKFKLKLDSIKGTEREGYKILSSDGNRVLIAECLLANESLFTIMLKNAPDRTKKYLKSTLENIGLNAGLNAKLLKKKITASFKDEFLKIYRDERDTTKALNWLENVAVGYSKWHDLTGQYAYSKLLSVPNTDNFYVNNTFIEEKMELEDLKLKLEKLIILCKIDEFDSSNLDVFKSINSHNDIELKYKQLNENLSLYHSKKKESELNLKQFGQTLRNILKDVDVDDHDFNSAIKLFEESLQNYLNEGKGIEEINKSYSTVRKVANKYSNRKGMSSWVEGFENSYETLIKLINDKRNEDFQLDQKITKITESIKVLNSYNEVIDEADRLKTIRVFKENELEEILDSFRKNGKTIREKMDQTLMDIYNASGILRLVKKQTNMLNKQWNQNDIIKVVREIFNDAYKAVQKFQAQGEKDDEYPEDDNNKKLLNTIQNDTPTVTLVPKQEPPSMNPNSKTELGPNIGGSTQPTEPKIKPMETSNGDPGEFKGCTLEEILANSKNLTEALRKAGDQVSISDQKLSKEQLDDLVKIATEKLQSTSQQDRDQVDKLALKAMHKLLEKPRSFNTDLVSRAYDIASKSYSDIKRVLEQKQKTIQQEESYNQESQKSVYFN